MPKGDWMKAQRAAVTGRVQMNGRGGVEGLDVGSGDVLPIGAVVDSGNNPGFPLLWKNFTNSGMFGGVAAACSREGLNGMRMTANSATTVQGMTLPLSKPSTIPTGDVSFLIYIADFGGETSFLTVDFYLGDGTAMSNSKTKSIGFLNPGWHWITISATANSSGWLWTNSPGTPVFGTTDFTHFRIRTSYANNNRPVLELYGVFEGVKTTRPQVVFTFDDGPSVAYTNGLPIMDKYNLPATMFLIADVLDGPLMMTRAQAADAVSRGHEVCPHGILGNTGQTLDSAYAGASSPYAAAKADILANKNLLLSFGLCRNGSENIYAWPGGAFAFGGVGSADTSLMQAARDAGIVCARNARPGMGNLSAARAGTKYDIMMLPIIGHSAVGDDSSTLAATISRLQYCAENGKHAIIMLHKVTDTQDAGHITKVNLEVLAQAAATEISAGRMVAGTMSSLYRALSQCL